MGLAGGVITAGGEAVIGFDRDGACSISPPHAKTDRRRDWRGRCAGRCDDRGATMKGLALRDALREGLAAAMLTVESRQPWRIIPTGNSPPHSLLCRLPKKWHEQSHILEITMTPETARSLHRYPRARGGGACRRKPGRRTGKHHHHPRHALSRQCHDGEERRKDHPRRRRCARDDRCCGRPAEDRPVGRGARNACQDDRRNEAFPGRSWPMRWRKGAPAAPRWPRR